MRCQRAIPCSFAVVREDKRPLRIEPSLHKFLAQRGPTGYSGAMSDQTVFRLRYRVPYSDCTIGNHVYYARIIEWLERARNEFFRHLGVTFQSLTDQGIMLPVITCHVDYKGAARYDDEVEIEVKVAELRGVRITFDYRITRPADGRLIATAQTIHACANLEERPQRLPDRLKTALGS